MGIVHLFPNHSVERWDRNKKRYRWAQGYSRATSTGYTVDPPKTRREWFDEGRRDGFVCRFHVSRELAIEAAKAD